MDALADFAAAKCAVAIRNAAAHNALSHALIISGSGERSAAAHYAAAAMQCTAEQGKPCCSCVQCRKVLSGIHPDVIFVRDKDHAEISIDIIRETRKDAFIRPNEGNRKIYVFEDCSILNEKDQNTLLKIVEEGPPYAAFIFCVENVNFLLQTIRSRCVELKTEADSKSECDLTEPLAFCRTLLQGTAARTERLCAWEQLWPSKKRGELAACLEQTRVLLCDCLRASYGAILSPERQKVASALLDHLTKTQILGTINLLEKYRNICSYNIGTGLQLGGLAVELEEIL